MLWALYINRNIDKEHKGGYRLAFGLQGMAGYSKCRAVLMATLYFVLLHLFSAHFVFKS